MHDTDFSSPLPRYEFQGVLSDVWLPIKVPKVSPQYQLIKQKGLPCDSDFLILIQLTYGHEAKNVFLEDFRMGGMCSLSSVCQIPVYSNPLLS